MSFELFLWHDGELKSTGKRFKTQQSAEEFAMHSYTGENAYPAGSDPAGFDVRKSADEPNQNS